MFIAASASTVISAPAKANHITDPEVERQFIVVVPAKIKRFVSQNSCALALEPFFSIVMSQFLTVVEP